MQADGQVAQRGHDLRGVAGADLPAAVRGSALPGPAADDHLVYAQHEVLIDLVAGRRG